MRSPWVGSLALLAPAHGFVAHPVVSGRGGTAMLQAFTRPASSVRALAAGGTWRQQLRLQQGVRGLPHACAVRMAGGGGGGGGGGGKAKKAKKPESYYKQTVILPQTEFQQVRRESVVDY